MSGAIRGLVVLVSILAACSSDDNGTPNGPPKRDQGVKADSKPKVDQAVTADRGVGDQGMPDQGAGGCIAGFATCTTFTDLTGEAEPRIDFGGTFGQTYAPKCAQIKVGQTITFWGSFSSHPLDQACGPRRVFKEDDPDIGFSSFTPGSAGVYGYYCTFHGTLAGTGMAGAIKVVP